MTALASSGAGSTPPLSLKSRNPYRSRAASARRDHRVGGHRLLVADAQPVVGVGGLVGGGPVGQVGLGAVADEEQVAQRLHAVALLALAEQRRDRHLEVLAEQVEQRRLDRGHRVHGDPQVEGLRAAAAGVAVGERRAACRRGRRGGRRCCGRSTIARASSSVRRMASPPGTSPTPVLPSESVRITRFRVKNGPCAPLRFSSMLSWPAMGTTRIVGDDGVGVSLMPSAYKCR